ncbi:MAG: SpaA isopeptide-forming pilin-related protein [Oscillospiraceae bacterium]|nr:SpaA isopeptide-forming pilin-related protein [Oscillospiraceae bacterium]
MKKTMFKRLLASFLCISILTAFVYPEAISPASAGINELKPDIIDTVDSDGIWFEIDGKEFNSDSASIPLELDEAFIIHFQFDMIPGAPNHPEDLVGETPYYLPLPQGLAPHDSLNDYGVTIDDYADISVVEYPENSGSGRYAIKFVFTPWAASEYILAGSIYMNYYFTATLLSSVFKGGEKLDGLDFGGFTIDFKNVNLLFNSKTLPRLRKGGVYDSDKNIATWTITITNNEFSPSPLEALRVVDIMSASKGAHTFAGGFEVRVDGTEIPGATAAQTANGFTYDFDGAWDTGWETAVITYKSEPNDEVFNITSNKDIEEESLFNRAELHSKSSTSAIPMSFDEADVTVEPHWLDKKALFEENQLGNERIISWTVTANNNNRAIYAIINDSLRPMGDGAEHYYDVGSVEITIGGIDVTDEHTPVFTYDSEGNPVTMKIEIGNVNQQVVVTYDSIVDVSNASYRNIGEALNDVDFYYDYTGGIGPGYTRSKHGVGFGMGFSVITKQGHSFNPANGELTWNVTLNQNKAALDNVIVTDFIEFEQEFVRIEGITPIPSYTNNGDRVEIDFGSIDGEINFRIVTKVTNYDYSEWSTEGELFSYYNRVTLNADRRTGTAPLGIEPVSSRGVIRIAPHLLTKDFVPYVDNTNPQNPITYAYNPSNYELTWKISVNEIGARIENAQVTDTLFPGTHFERADIDGVPLTGTLGTGTVTFDLGTIVNPSPELRVLTTPQTITVVTKISVPQAFFAYNSADTSLDKTIEIKNTATLSGDNIATFKEDAFVEVTSELLTKSAVQSSANDLEGREYITWTVPINLHKTALNLSTMGTIVDQLSPTLVLDIDNIKLHRNALEPTNPSDRLNINDGNLFRGTGLHETPTGYITYDRVKNEFTFSLANAINNTSGWTVNDTYYLVFGTFVNRSGNTTISNTVSFSGISNTPSSPGSVPTVGFNANAAGGSLGRVVITARDADTDKVLSKADFHLLDRFGNILQTATSGTNGQVTFNRIKYDTNYEIVLAGAPEGYWLTNSTLTHAGGNTPLSTPFFQMTNSPSTRVLNLDAKYIIMEGDVTIHSIVHDYVNLVNIYSTAAFNILPMINRLEGVTFTFTPANYATAAENNAAAYDVTTTASGAFPAGTLATHGTVITQKSAPTGYNINTAYNATAAASRTVSFNYNPIHTVNAEGTYRVASSGADYISTVMTANISFTKRNQFFGVSGFSGATQNAVTGANFTLKYANGFNLFNQPTRTNENGVMTFENVMYGDYLIEESGRPTGYITAATAGQFQQYNVSVTGQGETNRRNATGGAGTLPSNWVNHIEYRGAVTFDVFDRTITAQKLTATFKLLADGNEIGIVTYNGTTGVSTIISPAIHPTYGINYFNGSGLLYGNYTIVAEDDDVPAFYKGTTVAFRVQAPTTTVSVPLEYFANPFTIKGTCENAAGITVNATSNEMTITIVGRTDKGTTFEPVSYSTFASGSFNVTLPLGEYTITRTAVSDSYELTPTQAIDIFISEDGIRNEDDDLITEHTFHNVRKRYDVTIDAGANGAIAFAGSATSSAEVIHGANAPQIIVTPNSGYEIASITVNNVQRAITDENRAGHSFTLTNITADTAVVANFRIIHTVTVSAVTIPSGTGGTVSANRIVQDNASYTLTANAAANHEVTAVVITRGTAIDTAASEAALTALKSNTSYTVIAITSNVNIIVTFTRVYAISATFNTVNGGGFTGDGGSVTSAPQSVLHGGSATITATADTAFIITEVTVDGLPSPTALMVLQGGNPYQLNSITKDTAVHVTFTRKQYTVTAEVNGTGGIVSPETQTVWHGAQAGIITATPDAGMKVKEFTEASSVLTTNDTWTIPEAIVSDRTIMVEFENIAYNVEVIIKDGAAGTGGTATATPVSTIYGGASVIKAVPNAGNHISAASINGVQLNYDTPVTFTQFRAAAQSADGFSLENITEDQTIEITFGFINYEVFVEAFIGDDKTTDGGTATLSAVNANIGDVVKVTIQPNTAGFYELASITVDGVDKTAEVNGVELDVTITDDTHIKVFFRLISYDVTITSGANGTIAFANSATSPASVFHGANAPAVIITPNTSDGYEINEVTINGDDADSDELAILLAGDYIVIEDTIIHVTFKLRTYTVTAEAVTINGTSGITDDGGTALPEAQAVTHGNNATITTTTEADYEITAVTINGTANSFALIALRSANSYTLNSITADTDVIVTFTRKHNISVIVTDDTGGTASAEPAIVLNGGSSVISATADTGYYVSAVSVNGTTVEAASELTLTNITEDQTVEFTFDLIDYNIAVKSFIGSTETDDGGTTTASAATANYNEVIKITIEPNAAQFYEFVSIAVNGVDKTAEVSGFELEAIITDNTLVEAVFRKISYVITTDTIGDGTGTVTAPASAEHGADFTLEVAPDSGSKIESIAVSAGGDELDEDIISDILEAIIEHGEFVFESIAADYDIIVEFALIPAPNNTRRPGGGSGNNNDQGEDNNNQGQNQNNRPPDPLPEPEPEPEPEQPNNSGTGSNSQPQGINEHNAPAGTVFYSSQLPEGYTIVMGEDGVLYVYNSAGLRQGYIILPLDMTLEEYDIMANLIPLAPGEDINPRTSAGINIALAVTALLPVLLFKKRRRKAFIRN